MIERASGNNACDASTAPRHLSEPFVVEAPFRYRTLTLRPNHRSLLVMRPATPAHAPDAPPPDPALRDPHAAAHARVERQLQMLDRLAEMGMNIAEATERWALAALESGSASYVVPENHVMAAAPGGVRGDPGLVYARVARAVRQTLMLQTRLLQELPDLGRAETRARAARADARRSQAYRLVERAIRDEHADPEEIEHLSDEATERLREEDFCDDLGDRPFDEVVARICRDLGLSPDWAASQDRPEGALQGAAPPQSAPPGDPPPPAPTRGAGARAHPGPDLQAGGETGWETGWQTGPAPGPRLPAGAHGAPPGWGETAAP
ncbi:MAG: hypothetical protein B7Y99_08535 [Caulobacterales bacterium 32-69-10]|nr:MAG: hypothetical protein B7Y99_08535 [Caulobacterales bacterium 32-69-10]